MKLGKIFNLIYRKRKPVTVEKRKIAEDIYSPQSDDKYQKDYYQRQKEKIIQEQSHFNTQANEESSQWKNRLLNIKPIYLIAFLITFFALLIFAAVFFVHLRNTAFREELVQLTIQGPAQVKIGETVNYTLIIQNQNRVALQDVVLEVKLPDNFILQNEDELVMEKTLSGLKLKIGSLEKKSQKQYSLVFNIDFIENEMVDLEATATYRPDNVSSYFKTGVNKRIRLIRPEVSLLFFNSEAISSGEDIVLNLLIKNRTGETLRNWRVRLTYPDGFDLEAANPESNRDSTWEIPALRKGEEYKISIKGQLTGSVDAIKKFKAVLINEKGTVMNMTTTKVKIVPAKIILQQTVNTKVAFPGDVLEYQVHFKNNTAIPFRNLHLKVQLPDRYIVPHFIRSENNGYYDQEHNQLIWRPSDYEKLILLSPNEEGMVSYSIKLADKIIPKDKHDFNPQLISVAEMESQDVDSAVSTNKKIVSNTTKTKIGTVVSLSVRAQAMTNDNQPVALQAGEKVKVRIKMQLFNTTSKLEKAILTGELPSGIEWVSSEDHEIEFDKKRRQFKWDLGFVDPGTGFLSPPETAEMTIEIRPTINQLGNVITVIDKMILSGQDAFTGQKVKQQIPSIHSGLIQNLSMDGRVNQIIKN